MNARQWMGTNLARFASITQKGLPSHTNYTLCDTHSNKSILYQNWLLTQFSLESDNI